MFYETSHVATYLCITAMDYSKLCILTMQIKIYRNKLYIFVYLIVINFCITYIYVCNIKTHSRVLAAKKTKEDTKHSSMLFTGIVKLAILAFCISKTTIKISTKFTYFLP